MRFNIDYAEELLSYIEEEQKYKESNPSCCCEITPIFFSKMSEDLDRKLKQMSKDELYHTTVILLKNDKIRSDDYIWKAPDKLSKDFQINEITLQGYEYLNNIRETKQKKV